MYICPNCQHTSETAVAFCAHCGTAMVEQTVSAPVEAAAVTVEAPVYQQPVEAPVYQQPVEAPVYQQPVEAPVYQQPMYQQPTYQQPAYQQPTYQQPAYQQPAYQQPVYTYPETPAVEEPSKGKTITGMILSIVGAVLSSYFFLIMISASESVEMGAMGIVLSFFSAPLSLVGLLLSKNGSHTMNKVGKILGIVGLAVSGAMILFSLIVAIGSESTYYY